MKVSEAMHKGVNWVTPDASLAQVTKIMKDNDVGAVPVGENDRVIGMVTDRDVALPSLSEPDVWIGMASANVSAPLRWKRAKIHRGSRR